MKILTARRTFRFARRSGWHHSSLQPASLQTVYLDFAPYSWVNHEARAYLREELRSQGWRVFTPRSQKSLLVSAPASEIEHMLALVEIITGVKKTLPRACREMRYRGSLPMQLRFELAECYC